MPELEIYLAKAQQSLQGAESELLNRRFDNAVNRAYYACFQSAVVALIAAGVQVWLDEDRLISHEAVHGQFSGLLVYRRKLYPTSLRDVLQALMRERIIADYQPVVLSLARASRVVQRAQQFVAAVATRLQPEGGTTSR